jgi:hypothetical protein
MPVRVTCPACAATLSIRDEYAGRAVKCPKCAGLIPPQPAAPPTVSEAESVATVPPPPAPPEPAPEPAPDVSAKAESEPAPPPEKARDRDRDEGDEDDRPRKKKRRDEDDEDDDDDDRPRRQRRDDEDDRDEDDDRPRRKRRRDDDEDDEDDRPRRKRRRDEDDDDKPVVKPRYNAGKGSNTGVIVAVGALLVCLLAIGGGIYAYTQNEKTNRETEAANAAAKEKAEAANAFLAKFDRVKVGDARGRADDALGSGRVATADDLGKVFRNSSDAKKIVDWGAKVKDARVLIWQSDEAFALVALHPDADGRVMAKALRAKNASIDVGDLNDAAFLRKYPPKGETPPKGKSAPPGD